jgi:hypothetical protein
MYVFKFKTDKKQVKFKLLKPKDAHIKAMTFSLNKVAKNVELTTGKEIKTGPFPLVEGKNIVSFDGRSDLPEEIHELQVAPQWLS